MSKKRRPTAHEFKLLGKMAGGEQCSRGEYGSWTVAPVLVVDGKVRPVSESTVDALRSSGWAKRRYKASQRRYYLELTDAGHKAYEDEARRQLESAT